MSKNNFLCNYFVTQFNLPNVYRMSLVNKKLHNKIVNSWKKIICPGDLYPGLEHIYELKCSRPLYRYLQVIIFPKKKNENSYKFNCPKFAAYTYLQKVPNYHKFFDKEKFLINCKIYRRHKLAKLINQNLPDDYKRTIDNISISSFEKLFRLDFFQSNSWYDIVRIAMKYESSILFDIMYKHDKYDYVINWIVEKKNVTILRKLINSKNILVLKTILYYLIQYDWMGGFDMLTNNSQKMEQIYRYYRSFYKTPYSRELTTILRDKLWKYFEDRNKNFDIQKKHNNLLTKKNLSDEQIINHVLLFDNTVMFEHLLKTVDTKKIIVFKEKSPLCYDIFNSFVMKKLMIKK